MGGVSRHRWTRDDCSPCDDPFLRAVRDRLDRGAPRPGHGKVTDEDGHQWAIEGWLALADGTQTWTVRPLDQEHTEPATG